jgi:hypothetical protein
LFFAEHPDLVEESQNVVFASDVKFRAIMPCGVLLSKQGCFRISRGQFLVGRNDVVEVITQQRR